MTRSRQLDLYLFATRSDYEPVLMAVEAQQHLKYVQFGLLETATPATYFSALEIPDLGIAFRGTSGHEAIYLVMDRDDELEPHLVELYEGGVRYRISQLESPTSITFQPGGLLADTCIIRGDIGTVASTAASIELFRSFARQFRKRFIHYHGH